MAGELYRCGRCNHERRLGDGRTDWECPKCRRAYAKVGLAAFDVISPGRRLAGFQRPDVLAGLQSELGLTEDKARALLGGKDVTVKRRLTEGKARELAGRLRSIGVSASVRPSPGYATVAPGRAAPSSADSGETIRGEVVVEAHPVPIGPPGRLPVLARPRVRLRPGVKIAGFVLGLVVVGALARWGTLTPCGALEKELRWQATEAALLAQRGDANAWEGVGRLFGAALGGAMIEGLVDGLPPHQCASALVRMAFGDGPMLDAVAAPAPETASEETISQTAGDESQPAPRAARAVEPPEAPRVPQWEVDAQRSPLDDSVEVTAILASNDTLVGRFGVEHRPRLVVRCTAGRLEAFVNAGMPLEGWPPYEAGATTRARIRLGSASSHDAVVSYSTNGQSLFFRRPEPLVAQWAAHERLVVELHPANARAKPVVFDLEDWPDPREAVRAACPRADI